MTITEKPVSEREKLVQTAHRDDALTAVNGEGRVPLLRCGRQTGFLTWSTLALLLALFIVIGMATWQRGAVVFLQEQFKSAVMGFSEYVFVVHSTEKYPTYPVVVKGHSPWRAIIGGALEKLARSFPPLEFAKRASAHDVGAFRALSGFINGANRKPTNYYQSISEEREQKVSDLNFATAKNLWNIVGLWCIGMLVLAVGLFSRNVSPYFGPIVGWAGILIAFGSPYIVWWFAK